MTPQEYAADKAAPPGSSLHYALYFAARRHQPALRALHAYQREVTEIVHECRELSVAKVKLRWWQEELARVFDGQPQHPVAQALQQDAVGPYRLAKEYFEQVLEGVDMDLEYGLYPSFKELSLYCHRVGGSVTQLAVEICGYQDRHAPRFAHDMGMAFQLFSQLRHVRRNAARGRFHIPEDEMRQAGVSQQDLLLPQTTDKVRALFAQQAERIEKFMDQGLERLAPQDVAPQRPTLVLAELYRRLLGEMRREGFPLLEREFHLTPIRKFWIAWRSSRRLNKTKGNPP